MKHTSQVQYNAKEGEFVTLSGNPYIGVFYKTPSGILLSAEGQVIVQAEGRQTIASPPIDTPQLNNTLNENDTQYDLLPARINNPPIIIKSIAEASTPTIKPAIAAGTLTGDYMYLFDDGSVKVHAGTTFTLQVDAEQPDTLNVENGELIIKPSKADLLYQWTFDGVPISLFERDESQRATKVVQGNKLIITNMIPKWAGTYNCAVSNDIGSTDGGSINIEVFNSDVDSFFYTNLVTNPNGSLQDGTTSTDGWQSVTGELVSKQLEQTTVGEIDKSIVVDPSDTKFRWTQEMLFPRPYQIEKGVFQNSPINNIQSYFTRQKYEYAFKGGNTITQIYQDIDLTGLEQHIKGSIYGVSGVGAVISCYLGMAIYNYEPAAPYITPDLRAKSANYYLGSARLSFPNFYKTGPGFVKERAYVDIEEYSNEERVVSTYKGLKQVEPIRILDPWNIRLPKYDNRVYYQGGQDLLNPDNPSIGDDRDRHLWVADELFPKQEDRYTFGQYAEFNKIIINKLNPKTDKIRLIYTIESLGSLDFTIYERAKQVYNQITNGIFECPSWEGSWNSETAQKKENEPKLERNIFQVIQANYKTNKPWPDSIEERVPKASDSRAMATGFNVSLVPLEVGRDNDSVLKNTHTVNTKVARLIPAPIQNLPPYIAGDVGLRDLDITFRLANSREMQVQLLSKISNLPQVEAVQEPYSPGMLPLTKDNLITLPGLPANKLTVIGLTDALVRVKPNISVSPYYIKTLQSGNIYNGSYYVEKSSNFIELDTKGVFQGGTDEDVARPKNLAPRLPLDWYTISTIDRLALAGNTRALELLAQNNNGALSQKYSKWSIPGKPLEYKQYIKDWSNAFIKDGEDPTTLSAFYLPEDTSITSYTQWNLASRFIMTVGVHNTSLPDAITFTNTFNDATFLIPNQNQLYAIDNYYVDFIENDVVIHKTPRLYDLDSLPSFDTKELIDSDGRDALRGSDSTVKPTIDSDVKLFKLPVSGSVNMIPITIPINTTSGDSDKVATFELPATLLTLSREEGGLNIPQIENEQGELIPDPTYKVYLYGIRPAPTGYQITNYKQATSAQEVELDKAVVIGTPLGNLSREQQKLLSSSGASIPPNAFSGKIYTISNIKVENLMEDDET